MITFPPKNSFGIIVSLSVFSLLLAGTLFFPRRTICDLKPQKFIENVDIVFSAHESGDTMNEYSLEITDAQKSCIEEYLETKDNEAQERATRQYHENMIREPAAQAAINIFGANPDKIIYISWMKPGADLEYIGPIETVHILNGSDYYYRPETGEILSSPPEGLPEGYIPEEDDIFLLDFLENIP